QPLTKELASHEGNTENRQISRKDIRPKHQEGWHEWSPGELLWLPMSTRQGKPSAGMLLFRDTPWIDSEIVLLNNLSDAYQHALTALERGNGNPLSQLFNTLFRRPFQLLLGAVLLSTLALPVNESALAPAEVSPSKPIIVSAPLDGVVKSFHVQPNQVVAEGDLLFSLDKTTIQSQNEVAAKVLAIAKADYLRASQKAFRDAESKAKLSSLRAVVDEKTAELEYSSRLLERIQVRAEQAGIALFSDPNEWLGKPVVTGEKV
ncbi:MAG: biotin/lipoyl-binding protein, partial [Gammaproteobacteria bacterium]|nr:biotin/lipoyl-binding protein [Gammaproteobacteria bacterium]